MDPPLTPRHIVGEGHRHLARLAIAPQVAHLELALAKGGKEQLQPGDGRTSALTLAWGILGLAGFATI